jgi:hypothetical protein
LLKNEAEDGFSNESPEPSALEACAQGSLGLGNLVKTRGKSRNRRQNSDDDGFEQSNVNGRVGASHGYSLYGLFGPHSSWRKSIVPEVAQTAEQHHEHEQPSVAPTLKAGPNDSKSRNSTEPTVASTMLAPPAKESKQETRAQDVGPRFSAPWRIDWATLLKRVYDVDCLACPCGGRLKFVELVTELSTAREVLASMGLPTDLPPIARARSPDFYQESFPSDRD